jgi:hypothetical protein
VQGQEEKDRKKKTCTATPAASQGADDVGNPNPFKMRALRPPGNVGARRILRRDAACFRPGIASRPGGRKAAVHVVQCALGGPISGLQCMSFHPMTGWQLNAWHKALKVWFVVRRTPARGP